MSKSKKEQFLDAAQALVAETGDGLELYHLIFQVTAAAKAQEEAEVTTAVKTPTKAAPTPVVTSAGGSHKKFYPAAALHTPSSKQKNKVQSEKTKKSPGGMSNMAIRPSAKVASTPPAPHTPLAATKRATKKDDDSKNIVHQATPEDNVTPELDADALLMQYFPPQSSQSSHSLTPSKSATKKRGLTGSKTSGSPLKKQKKENIK